MDDSDIQPDVLTPEQPVAPPRGSTGITFSQYMILVAAGAFATTFSQQKAMIGNYPTLFLLKRHYHFAAQDVATFWLITAFAWNVKPLAGIFTDAFPLLRTRRRHYMILGAGFAGIFWLLMGGVNQEYYPFLMFSILMNVSLVVGSTVMGGLQVEAGQAYASPGRTTSLRQATQLLGGIAAPWLGGILARPSVPYMNTALVGAGCVLMLAIIAYLFLKEKPKPRVTMAEVEEQYGSGRPSYSIPPIIALMVAAVLALGVGMVLNPKTKNIGIALIALDLLYWFFVGAIKVPSFNPVVRRAQFQLIDIFKSRTLWLAATMLFLFYTVPGLNTALSYRQSDTLKFDEGFMGFLDSLGNGLGFLGALLYIPLCMRFKLRSLIIWSVLANALITFLYMSHFYTHSTAPLVHGLNGFSGYLVELSLMDLAVRSTPPGCEALGFSLMMSVRNFGISFSDILGTKMIDTLHTPFDWLVVLNATTTAIVLFFVPLLPRYIVMRREGEKFV